MPNLFTNNNDFDKYAKEEDNWVYDNGWSYKDEFFDSYQLEGFGKTESGKLIDYLVMLRNSEKRNKTIVLHGSGNQLHEIWSGATLTKEEYKIMMSSVNDFIREHDNK